MAVVLPGHGDRGLAQVFQNQAVIPQGAAGDHLDAVHKAIVPLHQRHHFPRPLMPMAMGMSVSVPVPVFMFMFMFMMTQIIHGILPGLHPQGQEGTAVAVKRLRLAQQPLQIAASDHLLQGLPGRRVFVHGCSLK
ncbi:MAG: hypothetical protein HY743_04425 [Deltaproteobacteria bacterium]|nr:hypothetical protein [Deltaproteobacteria bacterium]